MPKVVGIKFRSSAKVYYFAPGDLEDLERGDFVIVGTARGEEAGQVVFHPREIPEERIPSKLKGVLRRATAPDLVEMERYRQREEQALVRCREKVAEHGLTMKVMQAEYNFCGTHLTFYFTAGKRVDFRALVKDLVRTFRARIELRQIGVRDEVKMMGGHGLCGRPHCCSTWLTQFRPISIKMAKQQNLPLSPMEISGVCGRLLCCLAYENEYYGEVKRRMPRVGSTVSTPQGTGRVIALNVLQESVTVRLQGDVVSTFTAEEVALQPKSSEGPPADDRRRRKK